jgi:UDP-3-O-[3-hydroxymyristoyl] N-acetylglucosamine deacetylase
MLKQRTLKSMTRAVGVGIHSGQKVELTLRPAPGHRHRLPPWTCPPVDIPVGVDVGLRHPHGHHHQPGGDPAAPRCRPSSTCCRPAPAWAGQPLIDITADEVPILDGSASFVFLLQSAGIELQKAPKRFLRVKKPVEVRQGEGKKLMWARLEPHHGYTLSFEIEFDNPAVAPPASSCSTWARAYKKEIARARTFGMTKDIDLMRSRGLTLGGSMDNAIVIDDYKVLNADGLRYDDEFVKHKILDAIGDMHMAGTRCWRPTPRSRAATR